MNAPPHPRHHAVFFSDRHRAPDWRAALNEGGPACGLIFRDYDACDRAQLADEMRIFCQKSQRFFAIAGDYKLARRMGAAFHCPSHLLRRPLHHGPVGRFDTAAVHSAAELLAATEAGFQTVFISPVFPTRSHSDKTSLGPVRARCLAQNAASLGVTPFALGGMGPQNLRRLNGTIPIFSGYGAIDAFAAG